MNSCTTTVNVLEASTDNPKERDPGEIRALVHFSSPAEIGFLLKSVPRHKKMFPGAAVYIFFSSHDYDAVGSREGVAELMGLDGVHVHFADMRLYQRLFPYGEEGVRGVLESFELVCAYERLAANDILLRVPPFTLLTGDLFFTSVLERGARMAMPGYDAMPFGPGAYMLCAEYCHCLLRVVSLMGNTMAANKLADVYIQALAFAIFNNDKFFYASKGVRQLMGMQLHYDYDSPEEFEKLLPVSGFVEFLNKDHNEEDMDAALDKVIAALDAAVEQ